jgi:hypothetical protein
VTYVTKVLDSPALYGLRRLCTIFIQFNIKILKLFENFSESNETTLKQSFTLFENQVRFGEKFENFFRKSRLKNRFFRSSKIDL